MGRSPCCEKAHTNKGAWTKEEDHRLINYIRLHGEGCWRSLPKSAGLLRCGKSCRLRWINYLRPDLKRGNFSDEEDEAIIKLHSFLGNKWSLIAARLPGRTDNEIKNYWNTHIKRKLISRGIDPQTHRSLNTTAAAAFTTTTAASTKEPSKPRSICLDFRHAASLPPPETKPSLINETNISIEDSTNKCSSGTTEETRSPEHLPKEEQIGEEINLELSIGLPVISKSSLSSAESKVSFGFWGGGPGPSRTAPAMAATDTAVVGVANAAVCLCWQLGFQTGQLCRNCQIKNGFYITMKN